MSLNDQDRILIVNLDQSLDEKKVLDIFSAAGKISNILLSAGRCVIKYDSGESAMNAIFIFDGQTIFGKVLNIQLDDQPLDKRLFDYCVDVC